MSDGLSIAFAGGGCRSFWGLGVLEALGGELPAIREWAGVSAGAAMCLLLTSGRYQTTLDFFYDATDRNQRNVYPWNALRRRPLFPHRAMYGGAIRHTLIEGGLERVRTAPPVRILMAHAGRGARAWRAGLGGLLEFVDRERDDRVHGPVAPSAGLIERIATAQDAGDVEELTDWVLLSSATPGMIGAPLRAGRRYLDAALIDNVPVRALSAEARRGPMLVLLSRQFPPERLPGDANRLYLAPGEPIPVHEWDYTSPHLLRETIDLGRRDGERMRRRVIAFCARHFPASPARARASEAGVAPRIAPAAGFSPLATADGPG